MKNTIALVTGASSGIGETIAQRLTTAEGYSGDDDSDGRGVRFVEWKWDPDRNDTTFEVAYAFLMRESDGSTHVEMDRHHEGLFPREAWLTWLTEAGFTAQWQRDRWNRDVFTGRKLTSTG